MEIPCLELRFQRTSESSAISTKGMQMPGLFDPLAIRDLKFANRVFVSPMCQYSSRADFFDRFIAELVNRRSYLLATAARRGAQARAREISKN